jgi:hypothetical protein
MISENGKRILVRKALVLPVNGHAMPLSIYEFKPDTCECFNSSASSPDSAGIRDIKASGPVTLLDVDRPASSSAAAKLGMNRVHG